MYAFLISLFKKENEKNKGFEINFGKRRSKVKKKEVIEPEYSLLAFESRYAANASFFIIVFLGKITCLCELIMPL